MGLGRDSGEAVLWKMTQSLFHLLPSSAAAAAGRLFGRLFYYLDRRHRKIALSNLDTAFGISRTTREKKKIALRSFMHFGRMAAEILKYSRMSPEKIAARIDIEGEEHLRQALNQKKGILLFSAHYGNWEIAPLLISRLGKLNVIARPLDNSFLEENINRIRNKFGARVIPKNKAAKNVLRALQNNEMTAILIDQNVLRSQAVFVDFFGKAAATTPGLAVFHLRSGAPLIGVFCRPVSKTRYKILITEPVSAALSGDFERDIQEITRRCTAVIEEVIRSRPESWMWFHNRWKSRPENGD